MNEKSSVGYFNVNVLERKIHVNLKDFSLIDSMQKLNGIIRATVKAYTPLAFSSGEFYGRNGDVFYPLKRENGKIVIPGSSLKGAIRTYAEALSYSCHLDKPCGEFENGLCIDCAIFGTSGKKFSTMGKVHFNDVFLNPESVKIKEVGMSRQYNGKGNQIKIYSHKSKENGNKAFVYEAIDIGSMFDFEIQFHGMDERELGLLTLAMGCAKDKSFGLKFGHGKNEGYGSAKIDIKSLWIMPKGIFEKPQEQDISELHRYAQEYLGDKESDVIVQNLEDIKTDWEGAFNDKM